MTNAPNNQSRVTTAYSAMRILKLVCCGVVISSVLACIVLASLHSKGLVQIKVTAIDAAAEPRDHNIPLLKQKEALPDYEIDINLARGQNIHVGTKPNSSAIDGLTWKLSTPVSLSNIASIRLMDQDKVISDVIAEVQISDEPVTIDNYQFEFSTENSLSVGIQSFFDTPIGKSITGAFFLAVLLMLAPLFA